MAGAEVCGGEDTPVIGSGGPSRALGFYFENGRELLERSQ